LQQIKQTENTNPIPVMILSADAMNATVEEMLKLGATQYLSKPLNTLSFLDTIDLNIPRH
jgi:CheY-like chemotaxis protein